MLRWMQNYYTGEEIKNPEKVQSKISAGKFVPGIYLLTLSDNPGNLLEILPAGVLAQKTASSLCPLIVGMAKGHDNAIDLTVEILKEIYEKTGDFQVSAYLENR